MFKSFVFRLLHKNEKRKTNCISFSIFYENEKRMRALKIQIENLFNMKIVVHYLSFTFHIEIKKNLIINF